MRHLVLGMCLAGFLAGCGEKAGSATKLTIAGSTAFTPVAQKLADAFKAKHAGVAVDIQSVGSIVGIKNLNDGVCDLAMADLPENPDEMKGLETVSVSRDGIAVIVHPKNGVSGLTMEQVSKIFTGAITNWKEVGGADAKITVVTREANSGSRKAFDKAAGITDKVTKDAQSLTSSGTMKKSIAGDPNAIGYLTFVQVDASIKALAIGGAEAKIEAVKDGKYPIFAVDYLGTKGAAKGLAKEFIEFTLSADGQKIIKDAGLIPAK